MEATENVSAVLETLLDRHGIATVLDALAEVCGDKAEHVRTAWQDEGLAEAWDDIAARLSGLDASGIP